MKSKECFLWSLSLLLGGLVAVGIFTITAGYFLATDDAPSSANAIVVLGGNCGDFPRVEHALQLFDQGYAPLIVFSGGISERDAGLTCSSAQLSLEAAQQLGLPSEATIIADGAQSTYDEALNLRQLAQQHNWQTLIIVTDLFHTRRAGRTFHTLLPDITIYVAAAPDTDYNPSRWWQTEAGLIAVVNEALKLGFYWMKYGIAPVG